MIMATQLLWLVLLVLDEEVPLTSLSSTYATGNYLA